MNVWAWLALVVAGLVFLPSALVMGLAAAVTVWDWLHRRWATGYRVSGDALFMCGLLAVACCGYAAPVRDWPAFAVSFLLAGTFAWAARTEWAWADDMEGRRR